MKHNIGLLFSARHRTVGKSLLSPSTPSVNGSVGETVEIGDEEEELKSLEEPGAEELRLSREVSYVYKFLKYKYIKHNVFVN